jgi:hypothetical protein
MSREREVIPENTYFHYSSTKRIKTKDDSFYIFRMKSVSTKNYFKIVEPDYKYFCNKEDCEIRVKIRSKGWETSQFLVDIKFEEVLEDDQIEDITPRDTRNEVIHLSSDHKILHLVGYNSIREGLDLKVTPIFHGMRSWISFKNCPIFDQDQLLLGKETTSGFSLTLRKEELMEFS